MSLHLQIFDVKPHLAVGAMVLISRRELYRPIFTNTTAYYLGRSFSWSPTIKEVHIKAYFCDFKEPTELNVDKYMVDFIMKDRR